TLSQEKLCRPIVACELGRLYNKDAVIEFLLDKSADKTPVEAASHIKSIKNVTELNLADNPAWSGDKESKKGDTYDDIQSARFICPVVGLEMNGRHRFCFLRNCGCVFSERALKEIKTEVCHKKCPLLHGNKRKFELLQISGIIIIRSLLVLFQKSKKCKSAESAAQQVSTEDSAGPSKVENRKDCIASTAGEKRHIVFTRSSGWWLSMISWLAFSKNPLFSKHVLEAVFPSWSGRLLLSCHEAPWPTGTALSFFFKQSFAALSAKSVQNHRTGPAETLQGLLIVSSSFCPVCPIFHHAVSCGKYQYSGD
uniref:Replication termination factor 2 n=1 Tax=Pavo cristatus TaxID=9049 RepID=A0A8C9FUK9_PAVCR